jgi:hypothetical protein
VSAPETIRRPEFYVIGGTLRRDAPSYVVREADQRLYAALCQGQVCYALTPRQMGKSSLMVRTAARLREAQTSVAILDLTALGQNLTADQWYNGLLGRVGQQLDLEDHLENYWNDHMHLGPLQRWTGAIREVLLESCPGRIVIFIDEIDAVRSLPFSTDEFFAGIREAFNRRTQDIELNRLTFCLLGVATPSDLIRDTRTTPFNIGLRIELSDFTLEEAAPLAQGLSGDCEKGQQILRRVLYWTGGHPYLTQRLCQAVSEDQVNSMAAVDQVCGELFLSNRARERDDNLLFVRERMLRNETDVAGLLLLYGKVRNGGKVRDEETNPLVTVLRLAGIVCVQGSYLAVRNRIYAEVFDQAWVTANLPGAELRRQRLAYVRGLTIAAGVFVPLLLFGAAYGIYKEFRVVAPSGIDQPLKPPVFWASFTNQTLPTSNIGALLVSAGDAGISVFVNGEQFGRTEKDGSLQIPYLPARDYEIRLEKAGLQTVSQRVEIVPQRETRLTFKLSPVTFTSYMLVIGQAPPGTDIKIDGTPSGTTGADGTLSVKITPGEHTIELKREGYEARSFRQTLRPGENRIDGHLEIDQAFADWTRASNAGDPHAIAAFLTRYPNSRFEGEARARMEQLDWAKYQDCNDPLLLQEFIDKYPHGQHSVQARDLAIRLQQEDLEWRDAKTPTALKAFLEKYPRSRHANDAQTAIGIFKDQGDILALLKAYQDAYNRQDLKQLVQLWPRCPADLQAALNAGFKEKRSGTLVLLANGDPKVTGDIATLQVSRTRQTDAASTSGNVPFKFRKQNDRWFIENGSF